MADFSELYSMVGDFVQVGFMEAVRAYEPAQDRIRGSEVRRWLKMMRVDVKRFNALVKSGEIKPFRTGTGKNSPLYYSKKEIKQAVTAAKMSSIMLQHEIEL